MNSIEATVRNTKTRGELNALRKKGNVPGIIYGGKNQNQKVSIPTKEVKVLLEKEFSMTSLQMVDITPTTQLVHFI